MVVIYTFRSSQQDTDMGLVQLHHGVMQFIYPKEWPAELNWAADPEFPSNQSPNTKLPLPAATINTK